MENYRLIRPEHLNHYGFVFGGYLLMWVDETAWLAASRDFPECRFVTVGMDRVAFKKGVGEGAILRLLATRDRIGNTSVSYTITVTHDETVIFSTTVTLVCVDENGAKLPVPKK